MSKSEIDRILNAIDDIKKEIGKMYTSFSVKYTNNSRDIAGLTADMCDMKRKLGECKAEEDAKISTLTSFQTAEETKAGLKHAIVKNWKAILVILVITAIILLLIAGGIVYIMSKLPNIDRLIGEAIKNR